MTATRPSYTDADIALLTDLIDAGHRPRTDKDRLIIARASALPAKRQTAIRQQKTALINRLDDASMVAFFIARVDPYSIGLALQRIFAALPDEDAHTVAARRLLSGLGPYWIGILEAMIGELTDELWEESEA